MPAVSNFVTKHRLRDTYFSSVVAWLGLRYVTQSPSLRRVNCENDTTVFGSIPIGTDVFIYGKGQSTRVRRRRSKLNWTSRTWSFTRVPTIDSFEIAILFAKGFKEWNRHREYACEHNSTVDEKRSLRFIIISSVVMK